jgi:hypothetical protein
MKSLPTVVCLLALSVGLSVSVAVAEEQAAPKPAAPLPEGYKLLYRQSFDKPDSIKQFEFTDPPKWKHTLLPAKDESAPANGCLESTGQGKYRAKVRSPRVIGLIRDHVFEDFVLEADLLQTGKDYGHRDMCLFFGFTGPTQFYYVHMATKADKNAHNVFLVNDKPRTNIATKTTKGIDWGKAKWHHVRLERKASDGTIRVFFDDMSKPIMEANNKAFPTGCIGFGSFDDVGQIDNVRVWGPKVTRKTTSFFKKPGAKKAKPAADK